MRIACIVWEFPVLPETFILNQITGLIDRGHDVDIYTEELNSAAKVHPDVEKYCLLNRTLYYSDVAPTIPANRCLRVLKGFGLLFTDFYKDPTALLRSLDIFKHSKLRL